MRRRGRLHDSGSGRGVRTSTRSDERSKRSSNRRRTRSSCASLSGLEDGADCGVLREDRRLADAWRDLGEDRGVAASGAWLHEGYNLSGHKAAPGQCHCGNGNGCRTRGRAGDADRRRRGCRSGGLRLDRAVGVCGSPRGRQERTLWRRRRVLRFRRPCGPGNGSAYGRHATRAPSARCEHDDAARAAFESSARSRLGVGVELTPSRAGSRAAGWAPRRTTPSARGLAGRLGRSDPDGGGPLAHG